MQRFADPQRQLSIYEQIHGKRYDGLLSQHSTIIGIQDKSLMGMLKADLDEIYH